MADAVSRFRESLIGAKPKGNDDRTATTSRRGDQDAESSDEGETFDDILDEDDYVAKVLHRQRALAALMPPEDAFISSLPANVSARLFSTTPPAPPPSLPLRPGEKKPYSDYSTYSFTAGARESGPDSTGGGSGGSAEVTSATPGLLPPFSQFLSWDQLLCFGLAPGTGEGSGAQSPPAKVEKVEKRRDPFEFDPAGGALCVELRAVSGLVKVNGECDPWVVCTLIGANGVARGPPGVWARKRGTTGPSWEASRFVGPPGYVCSPGDRLEFRVFQGGVAGVAEDYARAMAQPPPLVGGDLVGIAELGNLDAVVPQPVGSEHETSLPVVRQVSSLLAYQAGVQANRLFPGLDLVSGGDSPGAGGAVRAGGEAVGSEGAGGATAIDRPCGLTMRVLVPPPSVKRVFFIRHGQSEWNRATEETFNVPDMIAIDHPLSERGIEEACGLKLAVEMQVSGCGKGEEADESVRVKHLTPPKAMFANDAAAIPPFPRMFSALQYSASAFFPRAFPLAIRASQDPRRRRACCSR